MRYWMASTVAAVWLVATAVVGPLRSSRVIPAIEHPDTPAHARSTTCWSVESKETSPDPARASDR